MMKRAEHCCHTCKTMARDQNSFKILATITLNICNNIESQPKSINL